VRNAVSGTAARPQRPPQGGTGEREIESWLGELRGKPGASGQQPPVQPPSAEPTRTMGDSDATTAIPTTPPAQTPAQEPAEDDTATRAIPVSKPRGGEAEAATEKLNSRSEADEKTRQRRGGGGVSAQDLLRREGRKL
jgi:RND superfamily putative drug exporter